MPPRFFVPASNFTPYAAILFFQQGPFFIENYRRTDYAYRDF